MVIVDSSIWVDHFRNGTQAVGRLASRADILMHPFVLTEVALGSLSDRAMTLRFLRRLVTPVLATQVDVDALIEEHRLFATGLDFVDVHLLASARLTSRCQLWCRDKKLLEAARLLGVAYEGS